VEVYQSDLAAEKEQEPIALQCFLSHQLPRIREWAEGEIHRRQAYMRIWRQHDEEEDMG
jgi:hypothetical protein